MSTNAESHREIGQALRTHLERGTFHTTRGTDTDYPRGSPDGLVQDVHTFAALWFKNEGPDTKPEYCIARVPFELFDFDYKIADWHPEAIDVEIIARAHVLRVAKGWNNHSTLAGYLENKPELAETMGFESPPSKKTLWKAWDKRFSDRHKDALERCAEEIVTLARYYDVPAPARAFQPDEDDEPTQSKREMTVSQTKQVWNHSKKFLKDEFSLDRAENAQIPESKFWQQHAFAGLMQDTCIQDGAKGLDYHIEGAPSGWTQRHHLHKLQVQRIREMFRATARRLVKEARRKSELSRKVTVAIDKTKGPREFKGHIERNDKGKNQEDWILGYKEEGPHFQWAAVQIVGDDIPIVLDLVPVYRGFHTWDIVDELLKHTKNFVNIDEVQLDREFDNDGVRDVIQNKHGLGYRMPGKKGRHRAKCTQLRRSGKLTHIQEDGGLDGSEPCKTIFVPAYNTDRFEPVDDEETDDEEEDDDPSLHQELIEDYAEATGTEVEESERMFSDLIDDMKEKEEERPTRGAQADVESYAVFRTNDPDVYVDEDASRVERIHMAERAVHEYTRWPIEEGFKKIKEFMVRTTSRDHELRFFNFAFAACLYNVWRLVDLLVQLSLGIEQDEPFVTVCEFLNCARAYFDIDSPPPPAQAQTASAV